MQQVVLDLLRKWRPENARRKRRKRDTRRKYSQRTIAKLAGISRGSVGKIKKRGKVVPVRVNGGKSPEPTQAYQIGVPPKTVRCDKCGKMGLAKMPCGECKLCRLHKQTKPVAHPPSDITLDLTPSQWLRLNEVRARIAKQPVPKIDLP